MPPATLAPTTAKHSLPPAHGCSTRLTPPRPPAHWPCPHRSSLRLGANPPSDCATEEDPYCFQYVRELSEGGKALQQLIDYAAGKPEVRFVTYSDLIRWMQVRVVQGLGGVGAAVG